MKLFDIEPDDIRKNQPKFAAQDLVEFIRISCYFNDFIIPRIITGGVGISLLSLLPPIKKSRQFQFPF